MSQVHDFTPFEKLLYVLSNGVTNSIFLLFDIRFILLKHVTYTHTYACTHILSVSYVDMFNK